jgi:hypothetical protein
MEQYLVGLNPLNTLLRPDISSSDFHLFGKVKSALIGRVIPDEIALPEAVAEILNGISDPGLQCVFRSWIELMKND